MRKAFSLLELVFVIVVIGILAAVIIPRSESTTASQAANQLQSHIRYTQHLAMQDDKFDATDATWFINRWQMVFSGNSYSIVSNNGARFALDTATGAAINGINLNNDYSTSITLSDGCAGEDRISFDHMGRPMVGDLSDDTSAYVDGQLLQDICTITLSSSGQGDIVLEISPETGYVERR